MSEEIKPAFYAIIPADVRYDKSLKHNAKLLYGEITALCNERGYCWAGNEYFAKLYGVSIKTITVWISQLVDKKYLLRKLVYKPGSKEIDSRILRLPMPYHLPSEKEIPSPLKNGEGESPLNEDTTQEEGGLPLPSKKGVPTHKKKEENITLEYISEVFNDNEVLKKNQNFIPLVVKWVIYKKQEKNQRYKTTESLTAWIKKLIRFSAGDLKVAEDIVETAMANLWMGIVKPGGNNRTKPVTVNFTPKNEIQEKYGGF